MGLGFGSVWTSVFALEKLGEIDFGKLVIWGFCEVLGSEFFLFFFCCWY